ncbi:hypothetical protein EV424DRAFT_1327709, partial [Suillus variegatus]
PPLMQHQVFSHDTDPSSPDGIEQIPPAVPLPSKIPKPRGEVSRLSWGRYNLQETLGWPASEYEETRAFVSQLAHEYLKVHKSWRLQAQPQLVIVYAEVGSGLTDGYEGSWVVGDMHHIFLKNSCSCDTSA